MRKYTRIFATLAASGLIATAAIGTAAAHPYGDCGARAHSEYGPRHGDFGGKAGQGTRGMLRGLDLTQTQRDEIFKIMYAQTPALRDAREQLRNDMTDLRQAATAKNYDAQKVRDLADRQAKTQAKLIVMRTEAFNKIYNVLTPEQQNQLKARQQRWHERFRH